MDRVCGGILYNNEYLDIFETGGNFYFIDPISRSEVHIEGAEPDGVLDLPSKMDLEKLLRSRVKNDDEILGYVHTTPSQWVKEQDGVVMFQPTVMHPIMKALTERHPGADLSVLQALTFRTALHLCVGFNEALLIASSGMSVSYTAHDRTDYDDLLLIAGASKEEMTDTIIEYI